MTSNRTQSSLLKSEMLDSTLVITMNRPERLNALTDGMKILFRDLLLSVRDDAEIRAVVVTGEGRAFCSGADLSSGDKSVGEDILPSRPAPRFGWLELFHKLPVPVIAAVNGPAVGGGFGIALACDIRVMGEGSYFYPAFTDRGLAADNGVSWMLPRLVGPAKALRWMWDASRIYSEEALQTGLADLVVADDKVLEEAVELAQKWAKGPTVAYGLIKDQVYAGLTEDYGTQLIAEEFQQARASATEDVAEGVAAFREKRAAKFVGR